MASLPSFARIGTCRNAEGRAGIESTLRNQERRYVAELSAYYHRRARERRQLEGRRLATLHAQATQWFEEQASSFDVSGNGDALFVELILREPAIEHRARAREILQHSRDPRFPFSEEYALHEYRRLGHASEFSYGIGFTSRVGARRFQFRSAQDTLSLADSTPTRTETPDSPVHECIDRIQRREAYGYTAVDARPGLRHMIAQQKHIRFNFSA